MIFDYIIVGAGSAGAVLANRLSTNPQVSVCLLEAGGKDTNPAIHIPFGLALMSRMKSVNWAFDTQPEANLNNRNLYWPRGKTLGGSSSINAMCYIRGIAKNFDDWANGGAKGWDYASLLPYFKKSEDNTRGESDIHGVGGPQSVSDLKHVNPLTHKFIEAANNVGLPSTNDFNEQQEGVGVYQVTQRDGQRCSTAKGYLSAEVKSRANLVIMTNVNVQRILFDENESLNNQTHRNKKATGVEVQSNNTKQTLFANKRVIISAGAIGSPQILMQSGIGDKAHLDSLNIPCVRNLPGVGQNLQDHLDGTLLYKTKTSESYGISIKGIIKNAIEPLHYLFNRKGMFSSNIAEGGAFLKSSEALEYPDIQIHFLPALLIDHGRTIPMGHGFTFHFCNLYPKSKGEIKLTKTTDGFAPLIHANYLQDSDDIKPMIAGYKWCRSVAQSSPLSIGAELWNEHAHLDTDDQIARYLKDNVETVYHPVGTCKMGSAKDNMSVVCERLSVHGVDGLSVVDASIMPNIIGGNTNATTIVIAEKASDMILADDA